MDANDKQSSSTPMVKPGLSIASATGTGAKFDQKVMLNSNQKGGDELSKETSSQREALAKQFVASQATMVMAKPTIFRR
ncbi:hypothetical protein F441_00633 [Phytophthora nicotianae CJ01A1]|uniref:Uncharacterized protein n=2 Tax=Phytophthora nicotianae TaxID=4792 RepID=W2XVQ8_PHYNI|nr:hypothetical protein F441_00633 [Phytophthora nicotianae CJ01A1]